MPYLLPRLRMLAALRPLVLVTVTLTLALAAAPVRADDDDPAALR